MPSDPAKPSAKLGLPKGGGLSPSAKPNLKNVGRQFAGRGARAAATAPFRHDEHKTPEWAFLHPKSED